MGYLVMFGGMVIIILLLAIAGSSSESKKKQQRSYNKAVCDNYDRELNKVFSANSSKKVYEHISNMEAYSDMLPSALKNKASGYLQSNKAEAYELARELELDEWKEKADKMLDEFLYYYEEIINGDFSNADTLFSEKRKCLNVYRKYMMSQEGMQTHTSPHAYMKDYLCAEYSNCMDDARSLEDALDKRIAELRPEKRRKEKLLRDIVNCVAEQGSIMRAKLLSISFDGYNSDEIKCCYHELVSKNRLAEIKMGNRYFVTLSDKEVASQEKKAAKR